MKEAEKRLEKVKYDLEQAKKYEEQGGDEFRYSLENFINDARSVFHIITNKLEENEKELKSSNKKEEAKKLEIWRSAQKDRLWKDLLFKFFRDKRNYVLKKGSLTLQLMVTVYDRINVKEKITVIKKDKYGNLISTISSESQNEEPRREKDSERTWIFEEYKDKSAIDLCESFIMLIEEELKQLKSFLDSNHIKLSE